MDDKEKKAIERIDYIQDFIIENGQYNADVNDMEYFSRILNLIENQQRKIEELQAINQMQKYRIEVMDPRELISRDEVESIITTEIEKLNKKEKENLKGTKGQDRYAIKQEYMYKRSSLQSILDKIKGDDK